VFVPCRLEQPGAIGELLAAAAPSVVYHLAAQSSAARSFQDPVGTHASNLIGTLHLLEAVRALPENRRPTVLAAGSCEEYGAQSGRQVPLTERSPLAPVSPYGASKAAQSLLCLQYHHAFGLPVIVSRAFSHTGPGQTARFVFPSFVQQIVAIERGENPAILAVGDISVVRDFLDVRDVTRAYRLLASEGEPGQVYNICSGQPLTIREGLEILRQEARCRIDLRHDPDRRRPADIPYMVGDCTKLRQRTGWKPECDIRNTLREMIAWAREERA
jgi:GDP-4-dehydro-6-deoxy-D-mannose reductase